MISSILIKWIIILKHLSYQLHNSKSNKLVNLSFIGWFIPISFTIVWTESYKLLSYDLYVFLFFSIYKSKSFNIFFFALILLFRISLYDNNKDETVFGTKSNISLNEEINKVILNRNEEPIHKKRRASLINTINLNIEKTNQNLNNPDEFYSNYFQLLLEDRNKNRGKDNKKLLSSIKINPLKNRNKKEKNRGLKKGNKIWPDT